MKFTLLEKVLVQGIAFAQGIVLARLLSPEDFGLVAMLGIFLGVGGILAESGLGNAYVIYGGDSRRVWRWNVGVAAIIYIVLAAAAPWVASFYRQPILKELMWVMGLSIIIYAASVVKMARLQREKRFGMISLVNLSSIVAAFGVGVGMAWSGFGVWSIVGAGLASGCVRLALLHVEKAGDSSPNRTADEQDVFRQMMGFGMRSMVNGLIGTLYFHSARLIIGKIFDPTVVGLFHRAQHWATLPGNMVNESVSRVALPRLAEVVGDKAVGSRFLMVGCGLLWPGLVVMWIWAEEIVGFVFGVQWLGAVPYLRILIFAAAFTPISNVAETDLKARGRADLLLVGEAFKKPMQIAALICGAFGGVEGLCWAIVVGEATSAAVNYALVRRSRK